MVIVILIPAVINTGALADIVDVRGDKSISVNVKIAPDPFIYITSFK